MKHKLILFPIALVLFIPATCVCAATGVPERPGNYVVDLAGIIDTPAETNLNVLLRELEQKTTVQMAVLTIKSLEGRSIEEFSIAVAHDKWKLGQKGEDNGILLVVALQDRKYRIEVGYGLEDVLPDSLIGTIGRDHLVPYFRKNEYSNGISAATLAIAKVIAEDAGVTLSGMAAADKEFFVKRKAKSSGVLAKLFSFLFFMVIVILFIRKPRLLLALFLLSSMGGRGSRWGGSGGGFGGGGFGGGGGGFGGGGASGSW